MLLISIVCYFVLRFSHNQLLTFVLINNNSRKKNEKMIIEIRAKKKCGRKKNVLNKLGTNIYMVAYFVDNMYENWQVIVVS